jgi:hypothetical protein
VSGSHNEPISLPRGKSRSRKPALKIDRDQPFQIVLRNPLPTIYLRVRLVVIMPA